MSLTSFYNDFCTLDLALDLDLALALDPDLGVFCFLVLVFLTGTDRALSAIAINASFERLRSQVPM
jgi:hypothetical protein